MVVYVKMDDEMKRRLQEAAKANFRTMCAEIRAAINAWLASGQAEAAQNKEKVDANPRRACAAAL